MVDREAKPAWHPMTVWERAREWTVDLDRGSLYWSILVGSSLSVAYLLLRSPAFKRITARNMPSRGISRLRGYVVHVNEANGTFHFLHQPWLRMILLGGEKDGKVRLFEDTIPMQLAGLNLDTAQRAQGRFRELIHQHHLVVHLVERPEDPFNSFTPVIAWRYNLTNVNTALLRGGFARAHDYNVPAYLTLRESLPRTWKRLEKAEAWARLTRQGMWSSRLVTSSKRRLQRLNPQYYIRTAALGLRALVFGRGARGRR